MAATTLTASTSAFMKKRKATKHKLTATPKITKKGLASTNGTTKKSTKTSVIAENLVGDTPGSRKVQKKALFDKRRRSRKPHYDLEKESAALWEKIRQRNLVKEDRTRIISELLGKMKGKISDMARSHVASRVLQTCIKYCQPDERDVAYSELRPNFLSLACNTYAHHLVTKMLDIANKEQLHQIISSLHGHVVSFLRHPVGSAVVEHAYKMANSVQKRELLSEFYSPEYRLFKGIIKKGNGSIIHLLANEPASKRAGVLQHMTMCLQPILEKGIIDHSIIHRALVEYLSIANKDMICEVVQQLSGSLLVRMVHTKDGAKVGAMCVTFGGPKERKKILKGLKGHISRIAHDEHGHLVLVAILNVSDDTKLMNKILISEMVKDLKDLILDKYGRRLLLHLLSPYSSRYFPSDILSVIQHPDKISGSLPQDGRLWGSLNSVAVRTVNDKEMQISDVITEAKIGHDIDIETEEPATVVIGTSKKDPFLRRLELLKDSGLAEKLTDTCSKHAGEFLCSPLGKDMIYEVARGGTENIMWQACPSGVTALHKAIGKLAAKSHASMTDSGNAEEHVFEQYHSSRTLRRLIIDCCPPPETEAPSFSSILWNKALKGKCEVWAKGHSEKVVSAFLNSADVEVKEAAKNELEPLLASGFLQRDTSNYKREKRKGYES